MCLECYLLWQVWFILGWYQFLTEAELFARCSLLFVRSSLLFACSSLLFACYFLLFARCSLAFVCCSLVFARCSLLFAGCSLLSAGCLLIFADCSLLFARCLLLFARCFFPAFMGNCQTISHTCYSYLRSTWVLYIFVLGVSQGNEDAGWVQNLILLFLCFM